MFHQSPERRVNGGVKGFVEVNVGVVRVGAELQMCDHLVDVVVRGVMFVEAVLLRVDEGVFCEESLKVGIEMCCDDFVDGVE